MQICTDFINDSYLYSCQLPTFVVVFIYFIYFFLPGKKIHSAVGRIALTMCVACASAGITQTVVSGLVQIYKRDTTFNANEIANTVLGALVAVTGCCPFITPAFSLIIGGVGVGGARWSGAP